MKYRQLHTEHHTGAIQPQTKTAPFPTGTRRDFLRRTLLTGAGVALSGMLLSPAEASGKLLRPHRRKPSVSPARLKSKSKTVPVKMMPIVESHVHVNQVGYLPGEPKRAIIPALGEIPGNSFSIVDEATMPRVRYQGELSSFETPPGATYGHFTHHFVARFDEFNRPGRYRLRLSNGQMSAPFTIGKDLYSGLIPLMLDYFAMQQCGDANDAFHGQCHHDDGIIVGGPREGQQLDGSGGWHDAGDYMKFVETTSYATALLLFTADNFPHHGVKHPVPGQLSPVLKQAKIGLDWLLKMHPTPDEFYFQIGEEGDHNTWRLPEQDCVDCNKDWKTRPAYFGVGANLAGRCAAAFALASRLYASHDQPFAHRCYEAAQTVYKLGQDNPDTLSTLPHDFYPEKTWEDDMEWGAIELYRATQQRQYLSDAIEYAHRAQSANEPTSIYNTHALAHYTLFRFVSGEDQAKVRNYLRTDAELARLRSDNPYGLATPYIWGTAEAAAGAALNCLLYARVMEYDDREAYRQVAQQQRDFILGCNPFNISYLIGAGTRYPLFPHHQVANIKKQELTGALVGGPADLHIFQAQKIELTTIEFTTMTPCPPPPADVPDEVAVYHDAVQDFVTNEPAIDYTAKFLLLAAFYHPKQ